MSDAITNDPELERKGCAAAAEYAQIHWAKLQRLVNDAAASWRALGNTIQKDVLASVVAPWIDALKAARDAFAEGRTGLESWER